MGQAKPSSFRLQIVQEQQTEGLSYLELSKRHGVSYNTIRDICTSYAALGESSLVPDYSACGRPARAEYEKGYRLVRLVKHLHSDWGIPYITTRVREYFPQLLLLSDRQYQRRLQADAAFKAVVPPPKLPKLPPPERPRQAHHEWQVDAKERIVLKDGSEACYLNFTDTKSHALLKAKAFPPGADMSGAASTDPANLAWPVYGMGNPGKNEE